MAAPVAEKVILSAAVGVAVVGVPAPSLAQLAPLQLVPVWPSQWVAGGGGGGSVCQIS